MKSKKTISILILISISFVFVSCKVAAYSDIHVGKYETCPSSDAHEMKIDIETRKADYFYITDLYALSYSIIGNDTIENIEGESGENKKNVKSSWIEAIIADDMKSITVKISKNESGVNRQSFIRLDNDKNKDMVQIHIIQHGSKPTKE